MSLTREMLDGLTCAHPDHDEAACTSNVLVLHSACHTGAPTWASYDKTTGDLTVACSVCDKTVGVIAVGDGETNTDLSGMDDDERAAALSAAGADVVGAVRTVYEMLDGDEAALGEILYECEKTARRTAEVES